jgi:hypothetical protein
LLRNATLRVAALLATCLVAAACELEDECDTDADPTCDDNVADGGIGSDAGTGNGDSGTGSDTTPEPEAPRYVWIYDFGSPISGSHPGPDIDAVELILPGGSSVFATRVTDSDRDTSVRNNATDTSQCLGAPFSADGACDVEATPSHWYSVAEGGLVVEFGRPIPDGSQIVIYECQGVADSYGVDIGFAPDASSGSANWQTLIDEASGLFRATVNYNQLGF